MNAAYAALFFVIFSLLLCGCVQQVSILGNVESGVIGEGKIEAFPLSYSPGERGEIVFNHPGENEVLACLMGKNYVGRRENVTYPRRRQPADYWTSEEDQCQKTKYGEARWRLIAPSDAPEGKYTFRVRYYADLTSNASILLSVITPAERESGTYQRSRATYENGKISISVSLPDYLLLREDKAEGDITLHFRGESMRIFDYHRFSFESKYPIIVREEEMQKLFFSIHAPKNVRIDCDAEREKGMYVVEFFGKSYADVYCSVEVEARDVISEKVYPITITARYGYYGETSPVTLELSEE